MGLVEAQPNTLSLVTSAPRGSAPSLFFSRTIPSSAICSARARDRSWVPSDMAPFAPALTFSRDDMGPTQIRLMQTTMASIPAAAACTWMVSFLAAEGFLTAHTINAAAIATTATAMTIK